MDCRLAYNIVIAGTFVFAFILIGHFATKYNKLKKQQQDPTEPDYWDRFNKLKWVLIIILLIEVMAACVPMKKYPTTGNCPENGDIIGTGAFYRK